MFDQKQILKQMVGFNKNAFNNTFNAVVTIQDQAERMTRTVQEQAGWLPEEGKNAFNAWIATCKKSRTEFKRLVDDNFKKVESQIAA